VDALNSTGWRDAVEIAIPALVLFALVAVPGEPRWMRKPWFIKDGVVLRRRYIAVPFVVLLVVAIVNAATS
jgi:hypothetical protein